MEAFTDVRDYLAALKSAIASKDKKKILELYEADKMNWDDVPASIGDEYDELVEQGNAICYGY